MKRAFLLSCLIFLITAAVKAQWTQPVTGMTNLISEFASGPPASVIATAGTPQSTQIGTAFATNLQVFVRDSSNNPVGGAVVTFTRPGTGASGSFAGGLNIATTDTSGVATAAVFTANTTAGSYFVMASVTGVPTPARFALTNISGPPASNIATAGTPQSTPIGTAFGTNLQVLVRDASNNPVSGTIVTFNRPTTGASGSFAGGLNIATTNTSGVATAVVFTANTTAGSYNVVATVAGVPTPAIFALTNTSSAAVEENATGELPTQYRLEQNYPNPFNPSTMIQYSIITSQHVSLKMFDALGREVETLVDGVREAGTYLIGWNAEGRSSGVYFYRLQTNGFSKTKKLILFY